MFLSRIPPVELPVPFQSDTPERASVSLWCTARVGCNPCVRDSHRFWHESSCRASLRTVRAGVSWVFELPVLPCRQRFVFSFSLPATPAAFLMALKAAAGPVKQKIASPEGTHHFPL